MMSKTFSASPEGIRGSLVKIEATLLSSLPQIIVTGLPGEVVKESRERVRACLVNSGFDVPSGKLVLHLSPAEIKKQGSQYDLGIALSILAAEGKISPMALSGVGFLGELSLDGTLCPVKGMLPLIDILNQSEHVSTIIIPQGNEFEGSLLESNKIYVAKSLGEVVQFLAEKGTLKRCQPREILVPNRIPRIFDQIRGQNLAKRAVLIALAGRHHLLLVGPPGVGKSMLSNAAVELLPELSPSDFLDIVKIYSASGMALENLIGSRTAPYRAPHHSISASALIGGGSSGRVSPGEISLAHRGVLFLDEFPEYRRDAIEGLREPLQSGQVNLNRIGKSTLLPSRFTLIAAMNPCPCGLYSPVENRCRCGSEKKMQYQRKLSTPILDRLSIMVQMSAGDSEPSDKLAEPNAEVVKNLIAYTSEVQERRYRKLGLILDSEIDLREPDFRLDPKCEETVKQWQLKSKASFRRINQTLRVARTIADLSRSDKILYPHLREAWNLRCFDFYRSF